MRKFGKAIAAIMLIIAVLDVCGCKKQDKDAIIPEVETSSISNITETSVEAGGVVISDGGSSIIERGICWSKEHNPIASDFHTIVEGSVGSFTCSLTELEPNTTYYLRAYAINSIGIAYGSEVSFVTYIHPNISVLTGENFIGDGDIIELDTEYTFGFVMNSTIGLSSLCVDVATDTNIEWTELTNTDISDCTEYTYIDSISISLAKDIIGEIMIRATVKDVNGGSQAASFTVRINANVNSDPLIAREFEWIRQGIQPGTGLEEFGLYWDSNDGLYWDVRAQIMPLEGVSLYWFDSSVWNETNTEISKFLLFVDAGEIMVYDNVGVLSSNDYDDVIGTKMPDGTFHLIHITRCDVYNDYLTRFTISGEAK